MIMDSNNTNSGSYEELIPVFRIFHNELPIDGLPRYKHPTWMQTIVTVSFKFHLGSSGNWIISTLAPSKKPRSFLLFRNLMMGVNGD
jgi:hypothetical protein